MHRVQFYITNERKEINFVVKKLENLSKNQSNLLSNEEFIETQNAIHKSERILREFLNQINQVN